MARATKGQQASDHLDTATALFTDAHDRLLLSEQLAHEAEQEERTRAQQHLDAADSHAVTAERASQIRTRIAAIIS